MSRNVTLLLFATLFGSISTACANISLFGDMKAYASRSILRDCKRFKDKDLRRTCRYISMNPLFAETDTPPLEDMVIEPGIVPIWKDPPSGSDSANRTVESRLAYTASLRHAAFDPPSEDECITEFRRTRSLSPWKYELSYDALRFPTQILYAKCLCTGCVNAYTHREDRDVVSKTIEAKATVIMMKSRDAQIWDCDSQTCEVRTVNIPVGCHCVSPTFS